MRRWDFHFAIGLLLSVVVHLAMMVASRRVFVGTPALPRHEEALSINLKNLKGLGEQEHPKKPDDPDFERDDMGDPDGKGIGANAVDGKEPLKAPQGDQDQALLSRDAAGRGRIGDLPSKWTGLPGEGGRGGQVGRSADALQAPPTPPARPQAASAADPLTPPPPDQAKPQSQPPPTLPQTLAKLPPAVGAPPPPVGVHEANAEPAPPRLTATAPPPKAQYSLEDKPRPTSGPAHEEPEIRPPTPSPAVAKPPTTEPTATPSDLTLAPTPAPQQQTPPPVAAPAPLLALAPPSAPLLPQPASPPAPPTPPQPPSPPPTPAAAPPMPKTPAPPEAPIRPSTGDARAPGAAAADPAPQSDSESDAFAKIGSAVFHNGKLEARRGRKVKTTRPRIDVSGIFDSFGLRDPTVVLKISIDPTGKVTSADVVRSSGSNDLDQPSRVAVYDWWFEPSRDGKGQPISDVVLFSITYR